MAKIIENILCRKKTVLFTHFEYSVSSHMPE